MRRYLIFLVGLVFLVSESIFVDIFSAKLYSIQSIIVPHFLLVFLILVVIYGNSNLGIWYGMFFGLLHDVVYTEIIGVYLFLYPAMMYLVGKLMRILQVNFFVISIVTLVTVAVFEFVVYQLYLLLGVVSMPLQNFVELRLFPTTVFNLIFLFLVAYWLSKSIAKWTQTND